PWPSRLVLVAGVAQRYLADKMNAGRPSPLTLVGLVWFTGSLIWFTLTARRVLRFHRLLRCAQPASTALQEQADALARRVGLRRAPGIYLLPGPLPPMLWALGGRPRLFFPSALLAQLSDSGKEALLMHE